MNAPERHRSYQLDEGQARMTYEPDQRVASAGTCVESTSASGVFLGDGAAVLARSSGEEPPPPRCRAGVASMAWRSTWRFRTNAP